MENITKVVLKYLEREPNFRQRKNKNKGIAILLNDIHPVINTPIKIPFETMVDIVKDCATIDRAWRKILEDRKDLRGSDYEDKKVLEQEKMLDLGYLPGHNKDLKTIKNLTL